jgi:hypothetical protein
MTTVPSLLGVWWGKCQGGTALAHYEEAGSGN